MNSDKDLLQAILAHYDLDGAAIHPIHMGNINRSFLVTGPDSRRFVLQRVNPMFPAVIHEDIEAVTRHLEAKGMLTPRLIPARKGQLFVQEKDECWRLLTHVPGHIYDRVGSEAAAFEAAGLLGRFHTALLDLDYEFRAVRPAAHDTARHLEILRTAVNRHQDHPRHEQASALAQDILALAESLPALPAVAERKVHGDPKITNVVFDSTTDRALCLIDFDTLCNMPLHLELGDALRSWCNPAGEDTRETFFSPSLFQAAVQGYAREAGGFILEEEWRAILPATRRIYIELAARFCADILNESYFNWDPKRFNSRSEHNAVRSLGQLNAARALQARFDQAEQIIERAFG